MAKQKRTPPGELVTSSVRRGISWYDALSSEDRQYVTNVVDVLLATPIAGIKPVAGALKRELGLSVSRETVAVKLRSLISEKA